MKPRTPAKHKPHVKSFCRQLVPGQAPLYVSHQPLIDQPFLECFSIVEQHVLANGGKQHFGWLITEFRKVWLEAEFHTIWEREDGVLIDLTPRSRAPDKVLFLPDPKRQYQGRRVNSVFKPLSGHSAVKRFIACADEHFRILEESDLPDKETVAFQIEQEMNQLMERIVQDHF